MTRTATVLALVVAMVTAPMAVAALPGESTPTGTSTPADGQAVQPGEKLAGVVAVQAAEVDGEVEERTFGIKVARANTSEAKAEVVAAEVENVEQRLKELERRKERLKQARKNGSISKGQFRAEMAELAVRISTVRRLANQSEQVAQRLPEEVLRANGVNVSAIKQLQQHAANLTGPQVARIARNIAGKSVGKSMAGTQGPEDLPGAANRTDAGTDAGKGGGAGKDAGNGDGAGKGDGAGQGAGGQNASGDADNATDPSETIRHADSNVTRAADLVDRAEKKLQGSSNETALAALENAKANLSAAREALEAARKATDAGNDERALEKAREALEHARTAIQQAREALAGATDGGGQSGQGGA